MAAPEASAAPAHSADAAGAVGDDELEALFAFLADYPLVIAAVSGGADSIGMMRLIARWQQRRAQPPKVTIATVDHGLRPASRAEAEWVVARAQELGFEAALLTWSGEKPTTGIQDAARAARYALLADLARRSAPQGRVAIVTAHTEDDQAETLLMRLARGSGVDGLAGMAPARPLDGDKRVMLLRPLLSVAGERLRATLRSLNAEWIEDPSNDATRFERVQVRKARDVLALLGIDNEKIALSARRLARAKAAIDAGVDKLKRDAALDLHAGAFASFDRGVWLGAPEELRIRMLGGLIGSFGGQSEPLRLSQLEALVTRMEREGFEGATLAGAMVSQHGGIVRVQREPGRVPLPSLVLVPGASATWDGRFFVAASDRAPAPIEVRPLGGDGYAALRRQLDPAPHLPASAAATLPSFWRSGSLIAVPTLTAVMGPVAALEGAAGLYSAEFLR
ncbi:tRNA lysidine(34) synthetase TilS [Hyphomicrobium album]|uniref:tRNA lysidine(34) synthetase TilS n=1 Tax=Hyphomicrobium album TaxID=2665159 RepID=UPI0018AC8BCE|nr:tRNA lysidine(34) synthetase TilS [Hyphomicrobium album]